MFFKSEKTARDVRLNPLGLPAKFHVDRAHRVEVTLRLPSPEEQTQGFKTDDAQCEATMQFDPSDKIAVALQDLAGSRLPEGSKEPEEWRREHDYIDQTGHIRDNYVAPWGVLPEGLQAFLRQTFAELRSALSVTVGALRWRLGDDGLHQPFASRGNSYSLDGEAWVRAPTETFVHVSTRGDLRITGTVAADVQLSRSAGRGAARARDLARKLGGTP